MEAVLLLTEVAGFAMVIAWLARGRGEAGVFAWRPPPKPTGKPRDDRRGKGR